MVRRKFVPTLLLAMIVAPIAANAAQNVNKTPKVVATVVLPKQTADTGPDNIGPFTTGKATPIIVDAETKQKLDDLAKVYQRTAVDNYQLIVKALELQDKPASTKIVHIVVTYAYTGVMATSGGDQGPRIEVSAKYALAHPSDVGAMVHEMVHVVQAYNFGNTPGWLTEAIADWVRWWVYQPGDDHTKVTQKNGVARSPYRIGARFLDWATHKYDAHLVPQLNLACQAGNYSDDLFKQYTGHTLDELEAEWKSTLPAG
jgi:hypothetical protein